MENAATIENVATLSSDGQITIPKAIRDELGLRPHDKLRFVIDGRKIQMEKAYPSLEEIAGSMHRDNVPPMEEWDEIIQEERAQAYKEKFG
ncbi:MAG: AbrB/MazE/SpoVT family DNA-binding domain-containing protein [Thermomicrobiales bacterium]